MTTKNSLVGVSIANRLSERHDIHMNGNKSGNDLAIYVHPSFNMRFIGRYCTVRGERSGGYVLKACLEEQYGHSSGPKNWVVTRLNKGWTPQSKQRAIHRMFLELSEQRTLKRHRERVHTLAESHNIDLDAIDEMAEGEGREITYDDMNISDCEFWKIELAKFPIKD